jgi:hypothetical protein
MFKDVDDRARKPYLKHVKLEPQKKRMERTGRDSIQRGNS